MVEGKEPDEVKSGHRHPSPLVDAAEWVVVAAFFAGVVFLSFHFNLLVFSWIYKLAVHFHYLP